MAVCNPSCVTDALPNFGSIDCDPSQALRSGELPYMGLIKCSTTFTDVLDPAEWMAKKAAGDITILPVGSSSIGERTSSKTRRINCQEYTVACEQTAEFTSAIVDNTTYGEWAKYQELNGKSLYLVPFWLDCNSNLIINGNWATGANIGISKKSMNFTQIWSGDADSEMEYKATIVLNSCSMHKIIDTKSVVGLTAAILS